MNMAFAVKTLASIAALVVATWHAKPVEPTFQGWVEANFVFIGADEVGRVENLFVREGDTVTAAAPLFTVDADLEKAIVTQDEATLANAQQTFHRAQELFKTGSGTKKEFDDAQSALSEAEARLNSARTRLNAPQRLRARKTVPSTKSITGPAKSCLSDGPWFRCCRRATSRCASSCRRASCPRSRTAMSQVAATAARQT